MFQLKIILRKEALAKQSKKKEHLSLGGVLQEESKLLPMSILVYFWYWMYNPNPSYSLYYVGEITMRVANFVESKHLIL